MKAAKELLLWCATPDGVLRSKTSLEQEEMSFVDYTYHEKQKHESLQHYLQHRIKKANQKEDSKGLCSQV